MGTSHGVGRGDHRADLAAGVAGVAGVLLAQHLLDGHRPAAQLELLRAPPGAFFGAGGEIDFALGVGKHDRALVAALGHQVVVAAGAALQFDQDGADARVVGGVVRHGRDFRSANCLRGIGAVDQHAVFADFQAKLPGEIHQLLGLIPVVALARSRQRDRAVHRAGIEESETEPASQGPGDCALAGAGRAIDRDNHAGLLQIAGDAGFQSRFYFSPLAAASRARNLPERAGRQFAQVAST